MTDKKDMPKMNSRDRNRLRDAIEAWADAPVDGVLARTLEPELFASIRPLLPIPDSDSSLPDGPFSTVPLMMEILALPTSSPVLMVNEPDEATQKKIVHLASAAADPKTDADELLRLAAEVERYVICIPWDLYKRASNHFLRLWMARIQCQEHGNLPTRNKGLDR